MFCGVFLHKTLLLHILLLRSKTGKNIKLFVYEILNGCIFQVSQHQLYQLWNTSSGLFLLPLSLPASLSTKWVAGNDLFYVPVVEPELSEPVAVRHFPSPANTYCCLSLWPPFFTMRLESFTEFLDCMAHSSLGSFLPNSAQEVELLLNDEQSCVMLQAAYLMIIKRQTIIKASTSVGRCHLHPLAHNKQQLSF